MQSLEGVSCVQVAAVTATWTSRSLLRCHDCAVWGRKKMTKAAMLIDASINSMLNKKTKTSQVNYVLHAG